MILIGVLVIGGILAVVALRTPSRGRGTKMYLAVSAVPVLLTVVVPVPFALAVRGQADWERTTVLTVSRVGITLSFILFTIGAVLSLRAALAGDRRAAVLLSLETALAGLPAGIVTAYAALVRFL